MENNNNTYKSKNNKKIMSSVFNSLQEKVSESINIRNLSLKLAEILRLNFEDMAEPIIYDELRDPNILKTPPWYESYFRGMGFLDEYKRNGNPYDYRKSVLNKDAYKAYEKLKADRHFERNPPKVRINCEARAS